MSMVGYMYLDMNKKKPLLLKNSFSVNLLFVCLFTHSFSNHWVTTLCETPHWRYKDEKSLFLHFRSFRVVKCISDIPIWNTEKVFPYKCCFKGKLHVVGMESWLQSQAVLGLNLFCHLQALPLGKLFNLYQPQGPYL